MLYSSKYVFIQLTNLPRLEGVSFHYRGFLLGNDICIELTLDTHRKVNLTDELSSPGCLISLSFTSNREPLTQHLLNLDNKFTSDILKRDRQGWREKGNVTEKTVLPHNIGSISGANFTQSCVGLKVLCILPK